MKVTTAPRLPWPCARDGETTAERAGQVPGTLNQVTYDEADPVTLTRGFLANPDQFLHHLFHDEP